MAGIPGLAGTEHAGLTVPDLEAATRFFVDVIGGRMLFDAGPIQATDDWMALHLGEPTTLTAGPFDRLAWVYFRAPRGLQLELVCSPQRPAHERAGGEWIWRPTKPDEEKK